MPHSAFIWIKLGVLVSTTLFSLVGCATVTDLLSSNPTSAPADTQISSKFSPNQDISTFGANASQLKGHYSGIYHCGNTTTQFVMHIKQAQNGQISGNMQRTNIAYDYRGKRQDAMTTDTLFKGQYDAKSATLQFRVNAPSRRFIHRHNQYAASLSGVILPDASGFILFNRTRFNQQCSLWIAKRGSDFPSEWEFLQDEANPVRKAGFFDRIRIKREQSKDRSRNKCDAKLAAWLKNTEKAPKSRHYQQQHLLRLMYSDKYFVPYFGKPFHEIDTDDRQIYAIQLGGSCQRDREVMQGRNNLASQLAYTFEHRSKITDVDKSIAEIGFNMLFAWMAQAKQHFAHMAKHQGDPVQVKSMLKHVEPTLQQLFPQDKTEFTTYAIAQYKKMIVPRLNQNLRTELANTPATFNALNKLASFDQRSIRSFPELDKKQLAPLMDKVKQTIHQSALPAAKQYATNRSDMPGIAQLDSWQKQHPHFHALLNRDNKQQINQLFNTRRLAIAAQLLNTEKQRYQQQVAQLGNTPAAVKAGVDYENRFNQHYSRLNQLPEYVAFHQYRQQTRRQLLSKTTGSLSSLINRLSHERTLKVFERNHLLKSDYRTSPGKTIYAALNKRRAEVAPFQTGGEFKHYLNALYSYDAQTLKKLDAASAQPIANAMNQLKPAMAGMGAIFEVISGGVIPGRKIMESSFAGIEEASLIYPVMAFYILNYEKYNSACIEASAHRRTVQYRWTEYNTVNGVRFETDSGGHDTHYRVNRRFNHIFNVIYRNDGNNGIAKFADRFFKGKGKIYRDELIKGTYNLMQLDCNSPMVKKMESNMIRYFDSAKARIDKAKRKAFTR